MIVWNKSRKRNAEGVQEQHARPSSDWIEVSAPDLAIVSDAEWAAAHAQLGTARERYDQATHGQRRRRDADSKYLLPSFGRCALCGGGLHVRTRSHGKRRVAFYGCTSHYNRGAEICRHVQLWPMEPLDRAVLASIAGDVLAPDVIEEIITAARAMFEASNRTDAGAELRAELAAVQREQARLTEAIATGAGAVAAVVDRLKANEAKRRDLVARLSGAAGRSAPAWSAIERRIRESLTDWRSLLAGDVAQVRTAFRQLLTTPIMFTPFEENGTRGIRFEGRIGLSAVLGGELVTNGTSPMPASWNQIVPWLRQIDGLRAA